MLGVQQAMQSLQITSLATMRLPCHVQAAPLSTLRFSLPRLETPLRRRASSRITLASALSQEASKTQPEKTSGPPFVVQQLTHVGLGWVASLVADAVSWLSQLVHLIRRVRAAAATIQAHAAAPNATVDPPAPSAAATDAPDAAPLAERLSVAAFSAITHLRHTLMDDTGTLDVKCRALESTTGDSMSSLFAVTRDTAAALGDVEMQNALSRSPAARAARKLAEECATTVKQQEEALRAAVFAQVLAEQRQQQRQRGGGTVGFTAA